MKVTTRFEGGAALARNLLAMPPALSRQILLDALTEAAEPMRVRASELAPRSDDPPHMADNIVIGAVSKNALEARGRSSETVVEVGPAKKPEDFFYGFFQEFSTAHHSAQPFMRPAFDEHAEASLQILADELWWAMRRGLPSGSERFV